MLRKSLIRFDRQARRRAVVCIAAAAGIASCAADGGVHDEAPHDETAAQTASAAQPPGAIKVTDVTASGTGCPSGSWRSSVSDDGSRVTVAFRRFFGETSRSARVTKNCNVSLSLHGQDGYQYIASTLHLSGTSDSFVTYSSDLRWSGTSETETVTAEAAGKFERSFFPDLWSPCGGEPKLHVNSQVKADARSSRGSFELIEEVISFKSRRCPGAPPVAPPVVPVDNKPEGDGTSLQPSVSISGATTSGSGCPASSTKVVLAPDGKAVSLSFDNLNGARSPACNIVLQVEAPAGQSYALAGFKANGQATLDAGDAARLLINTGYTGVGVEVAKEKVHEVSGPAAGALNIEQEFTGDELNFSPCDGSKPSLRLVVRPTLVDGKGSFQLTAIDSLKFALRSCE